MGSRRSARSRPPVRGRCEAGPHAASHWRRPDLRSASSYTSVRLSRLRTTGWWTHATSEPRWSWSPPRERPAGRPLPEAEAHAGAELALVAGSEARGRERRLDMHQHAKRHVCCWDYEYLAFARTEDRPAPDLGSPDPRPSVPVENQRSGGDPDRSGDGFGGVELA